MNKMGGFSISVWNLYALADSFTTTIKLCNWIASDSLFQRRTAQIMQIALNLPTMREMMVWDEKTLGTYFYHENLKMWKLYYYIQSIKKESNFDRVKTLIFREL